MPERKDHWEEVYEKKGSQGVSWYRPHLERSVGFIEQAGLSKDAAIIDVGGGASTLVDDLLAAGFTNLTVLDISKHALVAAQERLGSKASSVHWIEGDVTTVDLPPSAYAFWHDRAVFHFLTGEDARQKYVALATRAVAPGGHIVVATFGPEGPEKCSGLEVVRYDSEGLHAEFGSHFRKVSSITERHQTPWGTEQQFVYCYCRVEPN